MQRTAVLPNRPHTSLESPAAGSWARAGMASYWVVSGIAGLAMHGTDVAQVLGGTASAPQWLAAALIGFQIVTGVVFALGIATTVIARLWIAFAVFHAVGPGAFWSVPQEAVAATAQAFTIDLAIVASLGLFLHRGDRRPGSTS